MNPFEIVNDLSFGKKNLIGEVGENEKEYNAFLINKAFSYFPDTVFLANMMNVNHHIDRKLQHDYFFYEIPKRKRFEKWSKSETDINAVEAIKKVYGYGDQKAHEALSMLSKEQIAVLIDKCYTGGVK